MNSNMVTARIDVSKPEGRKIARNLEAKKSVEMNYPMPEGISGKTYTVDEVFGEVRAKLKRHYGVG
ncbi:hypothetical protein [Viscerimonas tarda]